MMLPLRVLVPVHVNLYRHLHIHRSLSTSGLQFKLSLMLLSFLYNILQEIRYSVGYSYMYAALLSHETFFPKKRQLDTWATKHVCGINSFQIINLKQNLWLLEMSFYSVWQITDRPTSALWLVHCCVVYKFAFLSYIILVF